MGLHGVACGAFAVTREWATGDLTIPIAAVGAGGWCVVALNGAGVDLRRLEIQAAP